MSQIIRGAFRSIDSADDVTGSFKKCKLHVSSKEGRNVTLGGKMRGSNPAHAIRIKKDSRDIRGMINRKRDKYAETCNTL